MLQCARYFCSKFAFTIRSYALSETEQKALKHVRVEFSLPASSNANGFRRFFKTENNVNSALRLKDFKKIQTQIDLPE